ncbi:MAG: ATP-dependent helicase DbpA [Fibrobacteres bacterium]|nr:ATP-dependent helicase DbpA [Fibrobacterota bacterium]
MDKTLFSNLQLPEALLANLETLGYLEMTPIQALALPLAMIGKDLIAQAKTGSGKTAAFGIPLLNGLDVLDPGTQALVICPTRELSIQVSNEMRRLARYRNNIKVVTVYGGQALSLQRAALEQGAHVVVGTPGRIKALLSREILALDGVRVLVLDEADRMLEMGFMDDVIDIIAATPKTRQTLLFSATYPENIQSLSARFQRDPARVNIEAQRSHSDIEQKMVACGSTAKFEAVVSLLSGFEPQSALIFCNTKIAAKEVYAYLDELGFSVGELHGDLEQRDREKILMRFRHQGCRVLVATDVAARGLDIDELSAVINFEAPHDPESYVHRIGRTGRAGKSGLAFTLFAPGERHKIDAIREFIGADIPIEPIASLSGGTGRPLVSDKVTLCIAAGRKDKIRPGDVLGALTGEGGIDGKAVGKIDVMDYDAYVTVDRKAAKKAFARLSENKIKGRKYKIRIL